MIRQVILCDICGERIKENERLSTIHIENIEEISPEETAPIEEEEATAGLGSLFG